MRSKRAGVTETRAIAVLVVVVVVAIACAAGLWVGQEAAIVRERREMIPPEGHDKIGSLRVWAEPVAPIHLAYARAWLGDTEYEVIWLKSAGDDDIARYRAAFSEAKVEPMPEFYGCDADH